MKENGMEKFAKLLREYNMSQSPYILGDADYYVDGGLYAPQIISKSYGFIKWLVDNDKIDLDKLKDNITFTAITHSIGIGCDWRTVREGESIIKAIGTNAIIAYLSIQDKPIEFLTNIIK